MPTIQQTCYASATSAFYTSNSIVYTQANNINGHHIDGHEQHESHHELQPDEHLTHEHRLSPMLAHQNPSNIVNTYTHPQPNAVSSMHSPLSYPTSLTTGAELLPLSSLSGGNLFWGPLRSGLISSIVTIF